MKKYVLIGTSSRGYAMYAKPIASSLSDHAKIVAVLDINKLRAQKVVELAEINCPVYTDFDKMAAETKPDAAIITTVDRYHSDYAVKCLDAGIDVVCEKPMTIDAEKCKAILDAEKRNGRKIVVTFNCRFMPYVAAVKKLLVDGAIGDILSADMEWMLDTRHGASYFRRWHRRKENSGGLLVHKSTHHFDMLNWWIDDEPAEVMAFGKRNYYGPVREKRGERCMTCSYKDECEFYTDLNANELARQLYVECGSEDNYYPDMCIFSEEIDIEDTMSLNVRYKNGALLSYSLNAHSAYEGWKVTFNGTKGRLEAAEYYSGVRKEEQFNYVDIYDRNGQKINYTIPKGTGNHGGGDDRLRDMIFIGGMEDPLGQMAGSYSGATSILIGIAANKSIAEGRNIKINELVPLDKYKG